MSEQLEGRELDAAIDRALGYEVEWRDDNPTNIAGGPLSSGKQPYIKAAEGEYRFVAAYHDDGCEYGIEAELLLQECIKSSGVIGATLRVNDVLAGYQEGFRVSIDCHHGIAFRGEGATWAEAKARACLALSEAVK